MLNPTISPSRSPRAARARVHPLLAAVLGCLAAASLASSAEAIPYFNAPFGFDNSSLMLDVDYEISLSATFDPIASGNTSLDIGLLSSDVVNDTASTIDRTITWTLINNAPADVTEFLVMFTALQPMGHDYSGANVDLDIAGSDPMVIMSYGPYTLAGYYLSLADFTLVNGDLVAVRTFRYTVDVAQDPSGPPYLGIARTSDFTRVPEPATGLLFAGAVLAAAGAGRRRHP